MQIDESELLAKKSLLIQMAKRSFDLGLQSNAGGNLSIRLSSAEASIIKPSGVGYSECTVDNLLVCDFDGNILLGQGKPSKDMDAHNAIYKVRPDVNAIVHVHSPWAAGWASSGREIPCFTVQAMEKVKRIPLIPLSKNGGPQGAAEIAPILADRSVNAAILENHGSIGLGKTLIDAQRMVEIIEETAHIAFVRDALQAIRN